MGFTEQQQERLAKERAEIAARVATFKATQQKFERERDEYFVTTLRDRAAAVLVVNEQTKSPERGAPGFVVTGNARYHWR